MSYTPTIWANGKTPAINADNLNKIENELVKLDNIVSVPDITETTSPTMPNSYDGRLLVEEIGGVCEQQTYQGYNMLDMSNAKGGTSYGITVTMNANGSYSYVGTAESEAINVWLLGNYGATNVLFTLTAGTYFIKGVALLNGTQNVANGGKDGGVWTFTEDKHITGVRAVSAVPGTNFNETIYPLIAKSNVALPWEPFVGNTPAPNPSYPQEIKKTVVSEIRTHGKNFYNPNTHSIIGSTLCIIGGNVYNSPDAEFMKQGEYTITYNANQNKALYVVDYDNNNVIANANMNNPATFAIPSDARVNIWLYSSNGVNDVVNLQLEKGTVATEYEPYTESVITLSQSIDLYGIGDVKDVIEDGKVKRRFYKFVLDGTQDSTNTQTGTSGGGVEYRYELPYPSFNSNINIVANALCNIAECISVNASWIYNIDSFALNVSALHLRVPSWTDVTNNTTLKAKLKSLYEAGNPVYVVYELATPTTEELPIADQIALNSLETFDGVTYLEFDSEIEPTFKGEYGTSKVGGYTLEGMLAGRNGELYGSRISALEASVVNNI